MRYPAVAGSFYPATAEGIKRQVLAYLNEARKEIAAKQAVPPIAAVSPHAGYIYSGKTAAYTFASLEESLKKKNTTVIFFGPNHTGIGVAPVSISHETWMTPVGKSETDLEVAGAIEKACPLVARDESAHLQEHSIEVQLPFLQIINPAAKVVCICISVQEGDVPLQVGRAVAKVVGEKKLSGRNFVVVASSDFTHYEEAEAARKKDLPAIEKAKKLDGAGLQMEVGLHNLSICGHGPIAAASEYAKLMGAKKGELLHYTNSGEETGDFGSVVAYASIAFYK